MSDTTAIINRILSDAEAQAAEIRGAAEAEAARILADADERAARILADAERRARADAAELSERRRTVAALEVKKLDLASKRNSLDRAFERALAKLTKLPANEYEALVASMLDRFAEYQDEIVLAKSAPIEPSYVMALPVYEIKKLRLARERGDFAGGLVLIGKTYDKRLTFETLIAEARVSLESEIAERLGE